MDRGSTTSRRKMPAAEVDLLERRFLKNRLLEHYKIPRLCLFYLLRRACPPGLRIELIAAAVFNLEVLPLEGRADFPHEPDGLSPTHRKPLRKTADFKAVTVASANGQLR